MDSLVLQFTTKDFLIQAPNDPEQQTRIWIETVTEETLEVRPGDGAACGWSPAAATGVFFRPRLSR